MSIKKAFATIITIMLAGAMYAQQIPTKTPPVLATDVPEKQIGVDQDSTHAARILTFEFDYPFKLNWKNGQKRGQYQMEKLDSPAWGTGPGNVVEIQKMTVSVNSKTDPATTYQQLKDGLILFFSTNGFIIQPGADFGDAIYWAASFSEIVLQTKNAIRLNVDIVSIRGRDANNNHVMFNWEQLRHYPFPKKTAAETSTPAVDAGKQ